MGKIKRFINSHKTAVVFALTMAIAACLIALTGLITLKDASGKSERRIINDDYSVLTSDITPRGITRNMGVKGGEEIYGVNLLFHTYDRIQYGEINVELWDGDTLLGKCTERTEYFLNDTFKGFLFPEPVSSGTDKVYKLKVYMTEGSGDGKIALWKSRDSYSGFEIEGEGGTLALQYVTDHTGSYIYKFYFIIAALALLALAVFFLLLFVFKVKIEVRVTAAVIAGGILFAVFTPPGAAPDENIHIGTSYYMAAAAQGKIDPWGWVIMRKSDRLECNAQLTRQGVYRVEDIEFVPATYDPFESQGYDLFRFKKTRRNLFGRASDSGDVLFWPERRPVFRPMYLASAAGMLLGWVMGFNFATLVFFGRLANLLLYAVLVYFSLKKAPGLKGLFRVIALLPMNLQLAGSMCYDAWVSGFSLLFVALLLDLIYGGKEKLTFKDIIPLAFSFAMLAPAKTVYVLMGLMVFAIPRSKFSDKKTSAGRKAAVLLSGLVLWALTNSGMVQSALTVHDRERPRREVSRQRPREEVPEEERVKVEYPYDIYVSSLPREPVPVDPDPDILPNGDSRFYFSIPYILSHIKQTAKLVVTTFLTLPDRYISSMLGTRLGEIILTDLTASDIFLIILVIAILLSAVGTEDDPVKPGKSTKLLFFLSSAAVFCAVVLACIMWTPANYEVIFGIQGRYFIPVLIPLLACLRGVGPVKVTRDLSRPLAFSVLAAGIGVVFNVFMIVCGVF